MANQLKERTAPAAIAGKNGLSLISDEKFQLLYTTLLKRQLLEQRLRFHLPGSDLRSVEAASIAVVIDLSPKDTLVLPSSQILTSHIKGVPLNQIVGYLHSRTSECDFHHSGARVTALISSLDKQLGSATGAALSSKIAKENSIAAVILDAESCHSADLLSRYQEAFEIASAHSLPVIYILYTEVGIAVSRPLQSRLQLPIMTVDSNDIVAAYRVAQESMTRARQGGGPTLIESRPYRQVGHADDHLQDDAVVNMEKYLTGKNLFSEGWKQQLIAEFNHELDAEIAQNASSISVDDRISKQDGVPLEASATFASANSHPTQ